MEFHTCLLSLFVIFIMNMVNASLFIIIFRQLYIFLLFIRNVIMVFIIIYLFTYLLVFFGS